MNDNQNRVEYIRDQKNLHSGLFTIFLEDHTLGNCVKMMLLRNPKVRFAGYKKPHPLENKIEIKIQTNGEITPTNALKEAFSNLSSDCKNSIQSFKVKDITIYIYLIF